MTDSTSDVQGSADAALINCLKEERAELRGIVEILFNTAILQHDATTTLITHMLQPTDAQANRQRVGEAVKAFVENHSEAPVWSGNGATEVRIQSMLQRVSHEGNRHRIESTIAARKQNVKATLQETYRHHAAKSASKGKSAEERERQRKDTRRIQDFKRKMRKAGWGCLTSSLAKRQDEGLAGRHMKEVSRNNTTYCRTVGSCADACSAQPRVLKQRSWSTKHLHAGLLCSPAGGSCIRPVPKR